MSQHPGWALQEAGGCQARVCLHPRRSCKRVPACSHTQRMCLCVCCVASCCAGNVVLNSKFYEDTSGNILNEICELRVSELLEQYHGGTDQYSCSTSSDQHTAVPQTAAGAAAVLSVGDPGLLLAAARPDTHSSVRSGVAWRRGRCMLESTLTHALLLLLLLSSPPTGKEYSKADSRYATRDDFVISMEAVTAFLEGPGCLLICWAMLKCKPWRFTAILLVSLGQLYGDVLYFGTCLHGGGSATCAVEGGRSVPAAA